MFLVKIYIFMVCILLVSNANANAKLRTLPFILTQIDNNSILLICKRLKIECTIGDTKLYQVKGNIDPHYYLIDPSPKLFKLRKEGAKFILIDQWDFKEYQHSHRSLGIEEGLSRAGLKIYPALYPLNKTDVSIAIIDDWFGGYSGGGSSEQYADFVQLYPHDKYNLAIADQLFYSSEMIRACFSEQDYHTSPHCHDESGTLLNIQFKDIGQNYYQWVLNYTDYDWPANAPETHKTTQKYSKTLIPFGNLK